MMSRSLLKQALDALVKIEPLIQSCGFTNQNITDAIKAELSKTEHSPVCYLRFAGCDWTDDPFFEFTCKYDDKGFAVYASQPSQIKPLTAEQLLKAVYAYGFTADDVENIGMDVIVDVVTAIEIEHGITTTSQPDQTPAN